MSSHVIGYASPFVAYPGSDVALRLSGDVDTIDVEVLRFRCADPAELGPGMRFDIMSVHNVDAKDVHVQPVPAGSFGHSTCNDLLDLRSGFTFTANIFPTKTCDAAEQTILTLVGGDGNVVFGLNGRSLFLEHPGEQGSRIQVPCDLPERVWSSVGFSADLRGSVRVFAKFQDELGISRTVSKEFDQINSSFSGLVSELYVAAAKRGEETPTSFFNGKVEHPKLFGETSVDLPQVTGAEDRQPLVHWDFSTAMSDQLVHDVCGNAEDLVLVNHPTRAVTGSNWNGYSHSWRQTPEQYAAIHFHEDDLTDARWAKTFIVTTDASWRSGFYAVKVEALKEGVQTTTHIPFFVSAAGSPKAKIAVLASTATFLAYANSALKLEFGAIDTLHEATPVMNPYDLVLMSNADIGFSTYDRHSDGSGISYSSSARPIINMQPGANPFNYVNDTHLLDWLEENEFDYDVITDDDLHCRGPEVLEPYTTLISASHPEYFSQQMLDAIQGYCENGGRHMSLGANGYYWRIAYLPGDHSIIEVRRGQQGTRTWEGEAGETHLASTGEPGGLWRTSGRAPQKLTGVGFAAQVFTNSGSYRRLPDSFQDRASFIFDGLTPGEIIGEFGFRGNGAAGMEVDRADPLLGTPAHALVVATADQLGGRAWPTPEEIYVTHGGLDGAQNRNVRADMVFYETANGGAVFSTGSIAWCCSLGWNQYKNNVSTVTLNVLRRFLDDTPFKVPETSIGHFWSVD